MSDSYRERVQELVDAIHLTASALRRMEWEASSASRGMRPGAMAPAVPWWPMLEPRSWPPIQLGAEREMMIPYVTHMIPQMVPMIPGMHPGLVHSGIGPVSGGYPMHPLQAIPSMIQGIYRSPGMVPYGYGYGLLHSPWEVHGMGIPMGGGHPFSSSPMMGFMPMSPMSPMTPMQPAWSMGPMSPSSGPTPGV